MSIRINGLSSHAPQSSQYRILWTRVLCSLEQRKASLRTTQFHLRYLWLALQAFPMSNLKIWVKRQYSEYKCNIPSPMPPFAIRWSWTMAFPALFPRHSFSGEAIHWKRLPLKLKAMFAAVFASSFPFPVAASNKRVVALAPSSAL